jgi:hypothetical protein
VVTLYAPVEPGVLAIELDDEEAHASRKPTVRGLINCRWLPSGVGSASLAHRSHLHLLLCAISGGDEPA